MFARDFWRTGRWHTLQAGDPGSDLYFVTPPQVEGPPGMNSALITFEANRVCMAYMQWAYTAAALGTAAGFTNAPGETSFDYAAHRQSAGPLEVATTYFLRVIIEDEDGTTLTSSAISFQTNGTTPSPNPSTEIGYRYDIYGAGASGNFPVLGVLANEAGQLYAGTPVAWNAANVKIVPTAYRNDAAGLASWVMNSVPNGASAAVPTFIVFDSSHAGASSTQYGAGTEYVFNNRATFINSAWNAVRRNLVFWGYNAKLNYLDDNGAPAGLLGFERGGWENIHVLGFDVYGAGKLRDAPTWQTDGQNGASEDGMFINITSWSGFKVLDCYVHHCAAIIEVREYGLGASGGYQHYDGWSHGPYSNGMEIGWNELYFSMNQGAAFHSGWNIDFHHNHIHDARQKLFNLEEYNYNYVGSKARQIRYVTIRDNKFGNYAWQRPGYDTYGNPQPLDASMISFQQSDHPSLGQKLDLYDDIQILRNEFYGGPMGSMNPAAETAVYRYCYSCAATGGRYAFGAVIPPAWQRDVCTPVTTLTVRENVSRLPQWCVDRNEAGSASWGGAAKVTTVIVEDNDFQGMDWKFHNCSSITWSGNGASTYTEY